MSIRDRIQNWHMRCFRSMFSEKMARDLTKVQPMAERYAKMFAMQGPKKPYNKDWEMDLVQMTLPILYGEDNDNIKSLQT